MTDILIEPLISILNNIQSKINVAAGMATALELRFRIIAQLEPKVQKELRKPYHKVELIHLIEAILKIFKCNLDLEDQEKIKNCRPLRNKTSHGSMVELMLNLGIEPTGREIDPRTGKRNVLNEEDLIEGVKSINRNSGLEKYTRQAKEIIEILDKKILRNLRQ